MSEPHENTSTVDSFVEVTLPLPPRRTFTYKLTAGQSERISLGSRVMVPFGNRLLTGYAVALHTTLDPELGIEETSVKNISEVLDEIPLVNEEILTLTKWTADYYAASWGEMLKASLPAGVNVTVVQFVQITELGRQHLLSRKSLRSVRDQILKRLAASHEVAVTELEKEFGKSGAKRSIRELVRSGDISVRDHELAEKVKPKRRKAVRLVPETEPAEGHKPLSQAQQRILDQLDRSGGEMIFTDLLQHADVGASSISTLAKRGALEIFTTEVRRDPLSGSGLSEHRDIVLNTDQSAVLLEIEKGLSSKEYKGFLLHGITGSGKTEVYIRAMRKALDADGSALMLVPEIALTPVFSRRLRSVFGSEVAILHSNLSQGERFDEWRRIRRGDARVVIGTRSAVFAPLENVGIDHCR